MPQEKTAEKTAAGIGDKIIREVKKTEAKFIGLNVKAREENSALILDVQISASVDLPGNFEGFIADLLNKALS